jgi:hypothetical protein
VTAVAEIRRETVSARNSAYAPTSKNPANSRQNRLVTVMKMTVISISYTLAGAPGFEPGNGGIKIRKRPLICEGFPVSCCICVALGKEVRAVPPPILAMIPSAPFVHR